MPLAVRRLLPVALVLAACATTRSTIPAEWTQVPEAPRIGSLALDAEGDVTHPAPVAAARTGTIRIGTTPAGQTIMNGETVLAGPFNAVDSLDVSDTRGEVVFSAKRDDGFDIGLVATEGSRINWFPRDPADEILVQWAPRGNKVSYVIRSAGGDVVRTLHVPTSFELSVPFPHARIHTLAWDPPAESYAVAYSTLISSDQAEVVRYDGGDRRVAVRPAEHLDAEIEPIAADAFLLRPRDLRYGETLPVVFQVVADNRWSDARAELLRRARVAVIVTSRFPGESLWAAAAAIPWLDVSRAYVIAAQGGSDRRGVVISGDAAVPVGEYRTGEGFVRVAPAVVQSFAAGFIAEELKRATPANATSR